MQRNARPGDVLPVVPASAALVVPDRASLAQRLAELRLGQLGYKLGPQADPGGPRPPGGRPDSAAGGGDPEALVAHLAAAVPLPLAARLAGAVGNADEAAQLRTALEGAPHPVITCLGAGLQARAYLQTARVSRARRQS